MKELIGTWRLVSFEERATEGSITHPYGEHALGLLVYDASGRMCVQVMRRDRGVLSAESLKEVELDELRSAIEGFTAFFGSYEVDEKDRTIIHTVEGHVLPNSVGKRLKRRFELAGNRLVLMPAENRRVVWERVT
jgi:hypothetical protein